MTRASGSVRTPGAVALCALMWTLLASSTLRAEPSQELLKRARDSFEYGDFRRTSDLLQGVADGGDLSESERIEAWRLLGLSCYYMENLTGAESAFFSLLKQNPDHQLDPFYVPPQAVSFFDAVRKRNEAYLAPIRERRRARIKAIEEDQRTESEPRRREEAARPALPTLVERRTNESSRLVAFMPFGLGQFQNGRPRLGTALMGAQVVAAATSFASYWFIEALRDPGGHFSEAVVDRARTADTVKWWSAGAFYVLWLAGVIEANVSYVPSRVVGESPVAPPAPIPNTTPAALEAAPER